MHTIKSAKGAQKKRKRIGRGNSAGQGTYSGRGLKGQNARSGVSNLKRLGMKQVLLRTPKKRGFKSIKAKDQVLNLSAINKFFKDKETISPSVLQDKGIIDTMNKGVKLLGEGKLLRKELKFKDIKMSESAKTQVEKMKGKIL